MATRRGVPEMKRHLELLAEHLRSRVIPAAARAGAKVIAQEARDILGDRRAETAGGAKVLIADAVKVRMRRREGGVVARVTLDGPGAYVGNWLEYGTAPHFISVDASQSSGMTAARINKAEAGGRRIVGGARRVRKDGEKRSLVIGGKFVGSTVHHPGARPHPFMRPALDRKHDEAVVAAQAYIDRRLTRAGRRAPVAEGDE